MRNLERGNLKSNDPDPYCVGNGCVRPGGQCLGLDVSLCLNYKAPLEGTQGRKVTCSFHTPLCRTSDLVHTPQGRGSRPGMADVPD